DDHRPGLDGANRGDIWPYAGNLVAVSGALNGRLWGVCRGRCQISRRALREERQARDDDRAQILLPAATSIETAVSSLLADDAFWRAARNAEVSLSQLDGEQLIGLEQVMDQDLTGLLTFLGYQPPPPATRLERDMRQALNYLIGKAAPPGFTSRQAQENLLIFSFQLRRTIKQASTETTAGARERLHALVRAGLRLAPPVVAAVAVALGFPAEGQAVVAFALTEGMKEALKETVTVGAMNGINRLLSPETAMASAADRLDAAAQRSAGVLHELRFLLEGGSTAQVDADRLRLLCVEAVDSIYGVLRAAATAPGRRISVGEACERALKTVSMIREGAEAGTGAQNLAELRDDLDSLVRYFEL
ncbi:hypothetical protein, partial [Nonomuraea monospora]|uniref:hypothetical protein n=1 Tax=Nonomuraea monospora TaxID=568818 RepID=UPI0031D5D4C0